MWVITENSDVAKRIREVENILTQKGISISFRGDGVIVTVKEEGKPDLDCVIRDESGLIQDFPCYYGPTHIQKLSTYLNG